MTDNSLLFENNYEPEYEDIVTSVINSLKSHAVDYCYTRKDMQAIFNEAKKTKSFHVLSRISRKRWKRRLF